MCYTVEAVLPVAAPATSVAGGSANVSGSSREASGEGACSSGSLSSSIEHVTRVEADLLQRREQLRAFEREYRQVIISLSLL